jgi:pimeloyl-ACP methyl ester carboxylesterase
MLDGLPRPARGALVTSKREPRDARCRSTREPQSADCGASGKRSSLAGFFRGRGDVIYARSIFWVMQAAGRRLQPAAPALTATVAGRAVFFGAVVSKPGQVMAEQAAADVEAFGRATDALKAVLAPADDFTRQLPADVPVTIAWGAKDRLLPRRQALVAKTVLPQAGFVLLPGCGHVPMTDDPS